MSSSDAITHGASVSFGRDICKAIYSKIPENIELWIMRGAVFGVGSIAYLIAIFGSEGLIQLLLGAYGPIAQLAPAVYASLFFRRVSAISIIIGLILKDDFLRGLFGIGELFINKLFSFLQFI